MLPNWIPNIWVEIWPIYVVQQWCFSFSGQPTWSGPNLQIVNLNIHPKKKKKKQFGASYVCSLWFRSGGHKSHQVFEAFVSCSTYESSTPLGWTYIQKQENISKSNISILDHLGMAQSRKPYCVFKNTLETKLGEFCAQPCLVCLLHMVIARRSRPYDSRLVLLSLLAWRFSQVKNIVDLLCVGSFFDSRLPVPLSR